MLLTKRTYVDFTDKEIPQKDVHQTRQSFKLGEITSEQIQKIGYELAMSWTKGKHQFIAATHINSTYPYAHYLQFCWIDAKHEYRNFPGSSFALRRASDQHF